MCGTSRMGRRSSTRIQRGGSSASSISKNRTHEQKR
jgi:hypothetical protein